jgi:hypothetical protein
MSRLRDQLRHARTGYLAVRYPGNLAVDVLWDGNALRPAEPVEIPPNSARWRIMFASGLGLTGVAAVILMFISVDRTPRPTFRARPAARPTYVSLLRMPPRPQTPQNVRVVPAGHPITRVSSAGIMGPFPGKPPTAAAPRRDP